MLVLLSLTALAAAGAGAVRAADPRLGGTIEHTVYADETRELHVWNHSTVAATFTFTPSGGWEVDRTIIPLDPDEQTSVTITKIGHVDGAPMEVRIGAVATPAPGTQRAEIALTAHLWTERPADYLLIIGIGVLVVVGVMVMVGWRIIRPPIVANS